MTHGNSLWRVLYIYKLPISIYQKGKEPRTIFTMGHGIWDTDKSIEHLWILIWKILCLFGLGLKLDQVVERFKSMVCIFLDKDPVVINIIQVILWGSGDDRQYQETNAIILYSCATFIIYNMNMIQKGWLVEPYVTRPRQSQLQLGRALLTLLTGVTFILYFPDTVHLEQCFFLLLCLLTESVTQESHQNYIISLYYEVHVDVIIVRINRGSTGVLFRKTDISSPLPP